MTHQDLLNTLASQALGLWDIPEDAFARLINVSENTTYVVENTAGFKAVLRIHRQGYNSRQAIESELAWTHALRQDKVISTPENLLGRNGEAVQFGEVDDVAGQHVMVMFAFVEGHHPDESQNLLQLYEQLGTLAAKCHQHAIDWATPAGFERLTWDAETVFGQHAHWGDWRHAPHVTPDVSTVLELVEKQVRQRLKTYGKRAHNFGLIHSDMRFANLLVDGEETHVIDFDDCGFSWFMYDFASTISFIEDHPDIEHFKQAWLGGYTQIRALNPDDVAIIDTMIMLRRMALLAWVGSHIDAPEPQALASNFARVTAGLGQRYLGSQPPTSRYNSIGSTTLKNHSK